MCAIKNIFSEELIDIVCGFEKREDVNVEIFKELKKDIIGSSVSLELELKRIYKKYKKEILEIHNKQFPETNLNGFDLKKRIYTILGMAHEIKSKRESLHAYYIASNAYENKNYLVDYYSEYFGDLFEDFYRKVDILIGEYAYLTDMEYSDFIREFNAKLENNSI